MGAAHQPAIPRWRGFNLTDLMSGRPGARYVESDFEWMAGWGFDFARLPVSYRSWSDPRDWLRIDDRALAPIDEAVEWGRQYGIHVNLNVHRLPGYCVSGEPEPFQLFDGARRSRDRALDAAAHHWRILARRYREVPADRLSFDVLNEPPFMTDDSRYAEVVRALVAAIRDESPGRTIFADGANLGQTPVPSLADLGLVQSTRGYLPKMVSHYTATWVPHDEFESFAAPEWPMRGRDGTLWDRERLRSELLTAWQPIVARGVPVHVGEWGCFNQTPRQAMLGWAADVLALWREAGWGWALWNLRGAFGIVDSERADVSYEDFDGHKLDRALLELLRAH